MANDTIPHRLLAQAKARPSAPAYHVRTEGGWVATDFKTYGEQMRMATRALIALGFEPGQTVTILGFNTAEWVLMDLAAMSAGGAAAGIYATCSPEEVHYIIDHSESPVILVEDESQWEKVKVGFDEAGGLSKLKYVVFMGDTNIAHEKTMTWSEFLKKGESVDDSEVDKRMDALEPADLATLIYTSGTTGPPKGVMLTHDNLSWTASVAKEMVDMGPSDTALSYLPLSHIAEQMFTIHGPITAGMSVYFAEAIEKVPDNLKEVQPTVFFGVPRIWEKFHAGVSNKMKDATGIKKKLLTWAMGVGTKATETRSKGGTPSGFAYSMATKLIFSKLKPAVGLGNARVCVTGAAPIAREVLEFFGSLDIPVLEVYGQSEDTGPTTFNKPNHFKFGTVGPAVPGVEVKIAEDGEIVVRGRNVFKGYFKDEAATNEALIDGWLHSGDLGAFDSDGFLSITGRKKDIIITAGGKNIAPKNIESSMKNHPLIDEAVVIGDRRKFLSCLVTIDPDAGAAFAKEEGIKGALHESEQIRAQVQSAVDETNKKFARVEQIKKFTILHRNFSVEDGELTPTLKVKRSKVNDHFADQIESMYG